MIATDKPYPIVDGAEKLLTLNTTAGTVSALVRVQVRDTVTATFEDSSYNEMMTAMQPFIPVKQNRAARRAEKRKAKRR